MSLILNTVSKSFNSIKAVSDINCEFMKGTTSVLIGPSGCGKSTLLRLIVGLSKPDIGTVIFDDEKLSETNLTSIRRKLGYVIQDGGLFPHLIAYDNISLLPRQIRWNETSISKRVEELSLLTKFPQDGLDRFPAELSGGQQQRVSLMRALMLDPEFLLLDEPLGALDPLIRFTLQEDLREIFTGLNKTVIMVTHDLNEAIFFADKIFLMCDGKILQSGSIDDLINTPADPFVSKFINAQRGQLTKGEK
ncbi:MAG: ATP-binding cassette domain-containing protein [Ignavibacteria bacterium]|jgi:osmoprotectant transport system ATP-binding protein